MHVASASNTVAYVSNTTHPTEALADRIIRSMRATGYDYTSLAGETGIAYSTLRNQLIYRPNRLTTENVYRISQVLRVPVSEWVA